MISKANQATNESGTSAPARIKRPYWSTYLHIPTSTLYRQTALGTGSTWKPISNSDDGTGSGGSGGGLPINYRVIAGVIRNEGLGDGWELLTTGSHIPLNIDNVSNTASVITIDYASLDVINIVSLIAAPDETFAGVYDFGTSVGLSSTSINIVERSRGKIASLITHSGNGVFTHNASGVTSVSYNNVTGVLRINHSSAFGHDATFSWMNRNDGEITIAKAVGSSESTIYRDYKFYNLDGTQKTLLDPELYRFYWTRSKEIRHLTDTILNPNNVSSATGNIWIMGIVEIDID